MSRWPESYAEQNDALWRIHRWLVSIRGLAGAGSDQATLEFTLLASAVRALTTGGFTAFESIRGSRPTSPPPRELTRNRALGSDDARRFLLALSDGLAVLERDGSVSLASLERATDSLEYLPCEAMRRGPAMMEDLESPSEAEYVRALYLSFRALLQ